MYRTRFVALSLALLASGFPPDSHPKEPFTVADSIALTRIVDPAQTSVLGVLEPIKRSPDGKYFFIVTHKGNLRADTLRYELLLFDVDEVLSFVANDDHAKQVSSHVLASFETRPIGANGKYGGITQARWLPDSRTVAFVGERVGAPPQAYTIDIRTRTLRALTAHPNPVRRFSLSADAERIVYVARKELPNWEERNLRGYAVDPENAINFMKLIPNKINTFVGEDLFIHDHSQTEAEPRRVEGVSGRLPPQGRIWLSPSGRWAIALTYAPDVPASWLAGYEDLRAIGNAQMQAKNNHAFASKRSFARRFVLINTTDATVSDILSSPVALGWQDVHWSPDERSVVLANTHLPLEGVGQRELALRRKTASVVEFELDSRRVTPIAYIDTDSKGGMILRTDRVDDGHIVITYARSGDNNTHTAHYRVTNLGEWAEGKSMDDKGIGQRLSLSVRQDMNTPPNVWATDRFTNRSRMITNLNPQLADHALGRVQKVEWRDVNGRIWEGGLMYPPSYDSGRRYPLVIQTYGFSQDEYVVDGPYGTSSAYAARPLNGAGIMVLQMGYRPKGNTFAFDNPMEGPNYIAGFESAVDFLDKRGCIDPERVGLIGFSRTGLHVSYAITFSEFQFAAATIADSTSAGYLNHIYSYGFSLPGMIANESQIGSRFWGDDRAIWLTNSPNFNVHRINTPLRLEHYGVKYNFYWDMFALLRRNRSPVEMIHIPLAYHVLQRPQARYTSQQGNVDWFAFWLEDYEDPDPSKTEQYERWRKLRSEQTTSKRKKKADVVTRAAATCIKQE